MEVNYEEIEKATSVGFAEMIKGRLGRNTTWKHFEIDESKNWYCILAVDCYATKPDCMFNAYQFQFDKIELEFYEQRMPIMWIREMMNKGWITASV